ncbi:hypothetical protein DPEC_G00278720 [Dallia pectoralis]|uniref:Uncharacterized protein n=1 Tax=Dallia pectoralis TaxID=75939 RepID=A0ACC2FM50_DALPE|nr:hypothetical protein DPEC_G00278720 [Dallia pectoralis]
MLCPRLDKRAGTRNKYVSFADTGGISRLCGAWEFNQVEKKRGWGGGVGPNLTATVHSTDRHWGILLIKKFNSTTGALASRYPEVRPCEPWRSLIMQRQILHRGGEEDVEALWRRCGGSSTGPAGRREAWRSVSCLGTWPISPLTRVTGPLVGRQRSGSDTLSWERRGVNAG